MAFDPLPDSWISGISEDGTDVTFPIASLAELSAAEVDTVTGDIRKFMFALCDHMADEWYATAAANRPAQMSISRSTSTDETAGTQTKQFVFRFTTAPTSNEVIAEPA